MSLLPLASRITGTASASTKMPQPARSPAPSGAGLLLLQTIEECVDIEGLYFQSALDPELIDPVLEHEPPASHVELTGQPKGPKLFHFAVPAEVVEIGQECSTIPLAIHCLACHREWQP